MGAFHLRHLGKVKAAALAIEAPIIHLWRMADEPVNITLEHLKAIRAENDKTHRMLFDMLQRLGSLAQKMGIAVTGIARVDAHLDGFDQRLDRIEKRLDLVGA